MWSVVTERSDSFTGRSSTSKLVFTASAERGSGNAALADRTLGRLLDLRQQSLIELNALLMSIPVRQVQSESDDVIFRKSGINSSQAKQAAQHKARTDQQHHGKSRLNHNECVTQPHMTARFGSAAAAFIQ